MMCVGIMQLSFSLNTVDSNLMTSLAKTTDFLSGSGPSSNRQYNEEELRENKVKVGCHIEVRSEQRGLPVKEDNACPSSNHHKTQYSTTLLPVDTNIPVQNPLSLKLLQQRTRGQPFCLPTRLHRLPRDSDLIRRGNIGECFECELIADVG